MGREDGQGGWERKRNSEDGMDACGIGQSWRMCVEDSITLGRKLEGGGDVQSLGSSWSGLIDRFNRQIL